MERIAGCSCDVAKAANFFYPAEWPQRVATGLAASCIVEEEEEQQQQQLAGSSDDQTGSTQPPHLGSPTAAGPLIVPVTSGPDGKLSALPEPSDDRDAAQLASLLRAAISYCQEGGTARKMGEENRQKGVKLYASILRLLRVQNGPELPRSRWPALSATAAELCRSSASQSPSSPHAALRAVMLSCRKCCCAILPFVDNYAGKRDRADICRSCFRSSGCKRSREISGPAKSSKCCAAGKTPIDALPISQVCALTTGPTAETATLNAANSPTAAATRMDLVTVSSVSSDPSDAADRHAHLKSFQDTDSHAGMASTSFADQPQSSSIQQMLAIGT